MVDVFDADTGALVWRGSVADAVGGGPLRASQKTETAVRLLLQRFPPPEEGLSPVESIPAQAPSPPGGS